MKNFFLQFFTWWHSQTLGTRFHTWRHGNKVGEDAQGNVYYQAGERRWVIYNGAAEASRIPAGWHGWMHHRTDTPPSEEASEHRSWELPHKENLTGTVGAYRPKGSILNPEKRPEVTGDYEAWSP